VTSRQQGRHPVEGRDPRRQTRGHRHLGGGQHSDRQGRAEAGITGERGRVFSVRAELRRLPAKRAAASDGRRRPREGHLQGRVLEIQLPKKEEAKPKTIKVEIG